MQIETTVSTMITTALKRGMSFKQVRDRVPALAAKQLGISVPEFHAQLAKLECRTGFEGLVVRVVSQFSPAERAEIARRK